MSSFFTRRFNTQLGTAGLGGFIPGASSPPPPRSDDVIQGEVIDPDKK
jgi:UPF0716 protein FxsA